MEEEGDIGKWAEVAPVDLRFEKELQKQQAELKRSKDELQRTSQVIYKKAELQKAELAEKQRRHNIKVLARKRDVELKINERRDEARRMMSLP